MAPGARKHCAFGDLRLERIALMKESRGATAAP
jgi:hypothetical protein